MAVETAHRVILASGSPRRRMILEALGVPFEVRISHLREDEAPSAVETPSGLAVRLALTKARAIAKDLSDAIVLGADTVVVVDGDLLGKPIGEADARAMLSRLKGRSHEVITGVALVLTAANTEQTTSRATTVHFRSYTDEEVTAYIHTGDPFDKAGSYAIQHPEFRPADSIEGCLYNVIGLPACLTWRMLHESGAVFKRWSSFDIPPPCRDAHCQLEKGF